MPPPLEGVATGTACGASLKLRTKMPFAATKVRRIRLASNGRISGPRTQSSRPEIRVNGISRFGPLDESSLCRRRQTRRRSARKMQDGARWRWREKVARGKTCMATEGGAKRRCVRLLLRPCLLPWASGATSFCSAQVLWFASARWCDLRRMIDFQFSGVFAQRFDDNERSAVGFHCTDFASADKLVEGRLTAPDDRARLFDRHEQRRCW
jgi:hypothetical protein